MIPKGSNEFELWKEVYGLRNKYAGNCNTKEQFKAVMNDSAALYEKYSKTDAAVPARWCCMMLREMFNEEYMQRIGERKENDGRKSE